jgi:hypothetical protein
MQQQQTGSAAGSMAAAVAAAAAGGMGESSAAAAGQLEALLGELRREAGLSEEQVRRAVTAAFAFLVFLVCLCCMFVCFVCLVSVAVHFAASVLRACVLLWQSCKELVRRAVTTVFAFVVLRVRLGMWLLKCAASVFLVLLLLLRCFSRSVSCFRCLLGDGTC